MGRTVISLTSHLSTDVPGREGSAWTFSPTKVIGRALASTVLQLLCWPILAPNEVCFLQGTTRESQHPSHLDLASFSPWKPSDTHSCIFNSFFSLASWLPHQPYIPSSHAVPKHPIYPNSSFKVHVRWHVPKFVPENRVTRADPAQHRHRHRTGPQNVPSSESAM